MRQSQRRLIEKRMAIGRFKRTHSDIPINEVSLKYEDGRFIFIHNNKVIDKIQIGGSDET